MGMGFLLDCHLQAIHIYLNGFMAPICKMDFKSGVEFKL